MRALLILAVLAGLTGCAQLPYQKTSFLRSEGYTDKRLGEGAWEVTFRTAGPDPEARYKNGALYRSAELAREAGFPFFQVVRYQGRLRTLVQGKGDRETSRPVDQVARLFIRGVRTPNEELKCESASPSDCRTYSTEETLRTVAPKLMLQPPGQAPEAAPPPGGA